MVASLYAHDVIVACAHDLAVRVDDVAVQLSDQLSRSVPEFFDDADLAREAQASARGNVTAMLAVFRGEAAADQVPVRPEVTAFASSVARRKLPLESLVQSYRVGQTLFSRLWMDVLAERLTEQTTFIQAVHSSFDELNTYLDRVVSTLITIYEQERDRWQRGAAARRTALVERLLRGEPIPVEQADIELGHDLRAPQTALVAWLPSRGDVEQQLSVLEAALVAVGAAGDTARPLTLPAGTCTMWAWLAGDVDTARLAECAATLRHPDLRIVGGQTLSGDNAFRISHEQAQRTRRVAARMVNPPRLTWHADVATVALLADDEEEARRFVEQTLRGLAARTETAAQLRETLWVFLQEGGNTRRAAERLFLHRNTVLYRLQRVDVLLGRPLDQQRLDVELALLLTTTFGDAILPTE